MKDKKIFRDIVNKDNPVILDIGCYDGKDSSSFLIEFPKAQIHAFEADPRSIELFRKNKDSSKISLNEFAISNKDGFIEWHASDSETRRHYEDQQNWSASSSIKKPVKHLEIFKDVYFQKPTMVKSQRLDTWFLKSELNQIDIIWADVNGGEKEFLEGARETIRHTRCIFMEFCENNLYEDCIGLEQVKIMLADFEVVGIYNFYGNFGNVLLKRPSS